MADGELLIIGEPDLPPISVTEDDMTPVQVDERDMTPLPTKRTDTGWYSPLRNFLRFLAIERASDGQGVRSYTVEEISWLNDSPYHVDEIQWLDDGVESEIKLLDRDGGVKEVVTSVGLTEEQKLNFTVWQQEQNAESAQLFFVNLRRNIHKMASTLYQRSDILRHNQQYYIDGNYAGSDDFLIASIGWGVPMAIYCPGRHAMLALKMPEFDENSKRWKLLVYNPQIGGEEYKFLEKIGGSRNDDAVEYEKDEKVFDEVDILEDTSIDVADDPIENAAAYGLLFSPDNANFMRLWREKKYDLSVSTDTMVAEESEAMREKQRRVQFDANNCVLASGHMAVIRAFLKYPELFDMKKRANIYRDTGVVYYLKDEVLRRAEPPSIDELVAAGGVGE